MAEIENASEQPANAGEQPGSPQVVVTPPTIRPAYEKSTKSSWPTVLGIIGAVLGILSILGSLCGAIFGMMFSAMSGMPSGGDVEAMQQTTAHLRPFMLASQAASMILAIVLTVGGFGLVSRRPWSRKTLIHWSWLKMLAVLVGVVLGYIYQQATFEMMQQAASSSGSGGAPPAMMGPMFRIFGGVGVVIGLVLGWTLPIFTLVWLNLGKIRAEVKTWT